MKILYLFFLSLFVTISYSQINLELANMTKLFIDSRSDFLVPFEFFNSENYYISDTDCSGTILHYKVDSIHVVKSLNKEDNDANFATMLIVAEIEGYGHHEKFSDLKISDFLYLPMTFDAGHISNEYLMKGYGAIITKTKGIIKSDCLLKDMYLKSKPTKYDGFRKYDLFCENKKIYSFYAMKMWDYSPFFRLDKSLKNNN